MMKNTLAALAVGAMMAALPTAADAAVTYTLVDQTYTYADPNVPASSRAPFGLSFILADAALADGTFHVDATGGSGPAVWSGDVADFLGGSVDGEGVSIGVFTRSSFSLDVTNTGASLVLQGDSVFASLSGSFASFGGAFESDGRAGCDGRFPCTVSGRLVSDVPEPVSLALLGTGLLGLSLARRRA